ncbi:MAG: DUF1326 domain-containing protein [Candidatus Pelagibacterales bacterium]|jgi:hypothetical protein|nr:DUF1326 domain-containing protein [Pelagibacterales bacterium]MDA9864981.1 DUF1326 domain-containing protein [Pelagibacterales bacterium]MDB4220253.1 DUF1326 domain-containing protein [Pelagibacterales bacterium]MDB9818928.1 DUF1326 domain-containing protein [Pelagibacterales bacterium]|tara:strand:+ start:464 stop:1111 length:648 start_codon:yes stop_codon:yes gene_type:complete
MTENQSILNWGIKGHFLLNCNCDVFCNCPMSLGKAIPNSANGKCFSWWGIIIENGHAEGENGKIDISGINVAILLEVPGPLSMGGWTAGLYIDEKASDEAADALLKIFSGQAGGQTGWFSVMISNFLGVKRCPIDYNETENGWTYTIPNILEGTIEKEPGLNKGEDVKVSNLKYWVAPEIIVGRGGKKSRIKDHGRNWDFTNGSAEYCAVDWSGP